jgi:hypothetical protein
MTWSEAFREQARSDMEAYELLCGTNLPICHQLHYLQMWLEKLCKAHLWLPEAENTELRYSHQVVATVLPRLIAAKWKSIGFDRRPDIAILRALCREVDLLHPQVDANGRRPDNVEYPWSTRGGAIRAPAKTKVSSAKLLGARGEQARILRKAAKFLTLSTP